MIGRDRRRDRTRLAWAAGAAGLVMLLVAPVARAAYTRSVEQARAATLDEARDTVDNALVADRSADVDPPQNTWHVNLADEWFSAYGDTWTDPPILSLAQPALGSTSSREYDFDGEWLAYGQWIGGDDVILTVVDRSEQERAVAGARVRWSLVALAVAAVSGVATWLALGRMQAPVQRAHNVNREFIADAAHELRTPLSIIQASAGHALARERSPEDYRESLQEILSATERAGSSVGELLEFARLEAGQATPRLAPLRLDLLVEEVAASIRVDGVTVEAVPGDAVVVEADYGLVRQVIDNITRNASARADKVTLATRLDRREAVIEVADDGPGFDPGMIDHVFERFRRGDRSGAVGLGMAVAQTIVELHGGSCSAENRADGGALVTIRLPFTPRSARHP